MEQRNRCNDGWLLWLVVCTAMLLGLMIWGNGCHTVSGIGRNLQDMTEDYTK
ncbi:MAG: hypothetical protein IMZ61_14025 [Planctomycetes bacterium]|nr:hypothetical protein [Planctomycetota bacterium]